MDVDTSAWSGEGEFTQVLVDHLDVVRMNDATHHTALFGEAVHRAL